MATLTAALDALSDPELYGLMVAIAGIALGVVVVLILRPAGARPVDDGCGFRRPERRR